MLPTPPEAPVTRTGPVPGGQAVVLEPVEGQRGGEAGRADGGRLAGVEAVGQGHHPCRRHPGQLGEPAVVGHPEVVAVDDDLAAGLDRGVGGVQHRAHQVDPGDQGGDAGHPVAGPGDHAVLVVDGRPVHPDDDVAGGEVVRGEGPDLASTPSPVRVTTKAANRSGTAHGEDADTREAGVEESVMAGTVLTPWPARD